MKRAIYIALLLLIIASAYLIISSEDTQGNNQKMLSCEIPSEPLSHASNHSFFCCPGKVGYWISAGYKPPGKTVGFEAQNVPPNYNETVIFVVYKKIGNSWRVLYTKNDWHAEFTLPPDQNVTYALSVYVFNEDCSLIDTLYSKVFVPIQDFRAEMHLNKKIYSSWETAKLTVKNTGKVPILLGNPYEIYRFENGSWKKVKLGMPFTLEGHELMPGKSWAQEIRLVYLDENWNPHPLSPGKYKIVKNVEGIGVEETLTLEVEFEIGEY
ncbi:hypothetical protein E3E22_00705 [Thermococcus sp. MV5]|uniref:immunoglobulin-like domain-containing protein n=1 Tax=Thermococcus sp. MV5 TaxID=1638272 RepID=UPI001438BD6B|nr:immunoglobulin-like domain-containing protein [Thermococcus sp. MV5]NJE25171.1 hypothetical protein [Thermococcus sp. MV5]